MQKDVTSGIIAIAIYAFSAALWGQSQPGWVLQRPLPTGS